MSLAQEKSPFKFLDSYNAEDSDIFFGRDREVEEVYDKVFQSKLLLVYGASGTGKSSIINCGLANKFDESDWFPIRIRRGGNIRRSLFNQINKEAIQKVELSDEEKATNQGLQKVINSVYLDHFKPIYLIFDQFEELFIFGFKDEWKDFISAIRFLMDSDLDLHFIFITRGEYLEFLSEFEELIPEFFDNRVRVEKMTRKKAQETIQGPAQEHAIAIEAGFEEHLLKKLSPDKSQIELTFLQVFLDKIYKTATTNAAGDTIEFTNAQIEELGQLGDVLAEFVDEQLFQMEDPKAALTVLKSFVSLQGTKVQNSLNEVAGYCQDLGQPISIDQIEEIIRSFINKRILKDHDDNEKYELRHDSLAQKIFEKITNQEKELLDVKQFLNYSLNEYQKRGTLLSDEDLGYVAFYERNLEINKELREFIELSKRSSTKRLREKKTRAFIIAVILLLLLTSVFGFFYSQIQKGKAEEQTQIAEKESEEAVRQREIAELQQRRALESEAEAKMQANIANQQRLKAQEASQEANFQRNEALNQRRIAQEQERLAVASKNDAERNAEQALKNQQKAIEASQLAKKLQMQSTARVIANNATQQRNTNLKILLSKLAHDINIKNGGYTYQNEIYDALYSALNTINNNEHKLQTGNQPLITLFHDGNVAFVITKDGSIMKDVFDENEKLSLPIEENEIITGYATLDNSSFWIGTDEGNFYHFELDQLQISNSFGFKNADIIDFKEIGESKLVLASRSRLILIENGIRQKEVALTGGFKSMEFTGKDLFVVSGNQLYILNEQLEYEEKEIPSDIDVSTLAVNSANKDQIYLGSKSGKVSIYDFQNQTIVKELGGHSAAITNITFDQNGDFMATTSYDRTAKIWNLNQLSQSPITLKDHSSWCTNATFASSGRSIFVSTYDGIITEYPVGPSQFEINWCDYIKEELTLEEWNEYVSKEIKYETICK